MNRLHPSLILIMVMLTALFVLSGCDGESANGSAVSTAAGSRGNVLPVETMTLVRTDMQERFTLPGTLQAWEDLTLAAEVSGLVTWVGPKEGERLKRGRPILAIDPEIRQASYDRDQVEAELKKKKLERLQSLVEQQLVSQQEYEDGVNAYERARITLRLSELQLEKSTLKMPITGILNDLLVDRGEYVSPGDPLAVVVQIDRLKVEVDVPEKDISYLNAGETVDVVQANIGSGAGVQRQGKVVYLAYKADPVTRTYRALIEIDNQDRQLRPGMIMRVAAVRRELPQVVTIPLYALVNRDGNKVVFVEHEAVATLREVEVETIIGDQVVIRSGLQAGEKLIIKGQQLVVDGVRVEAGE